LLVAGLLVVSATSAFPQTAQTPQTPPPGKPPAGGGAVAELRKAIAGKENQPAETVFKNIQMLKGVPAERLLTLMDTGFKPALGVKCTYCHDPQNWSSDDKSEKKVARKMLEMVKDINGKYLKSIEGLKSEQPHVSCATCHRGQEKPATSMEPAPAAGH
jgi:hypothetical protein